MHSLTLRKILAINCLSFKKKEKLNDKAVLNEQFLTNVNLLSFSHEGDKLLNQNIMRIIGPECVQLPGQNKCCKNYYLVQNWVHGI